MGSCLRSAALREENACAPRPYLSKGQDCAQWSGSLLLPPDEPALPSAPMADTPGSGTDTSSAAEHPLCSSKDGCTWGGGGGGRWRVGQKGQDNLGNKIQPWKPPAPPTPLGLLTGSQWGRAVPHSLRGQTECPRSRSGWSLWYRWVGEVRRAGLGRVRKMRGESKLLTNEYIDGIRFKPRQELSLEIDALKVHVDSAENIKTVRVHDLLGGGWQMGLLDW